MTTLLEDRLSDFGVDVTDTRARLTAYHQVENTYLSTFQALGALGLLLGTFGLAAVLARNVLERRRELGLLGAIGFTRTPSAHDGRGGEPAARGLRHRDRDRRRARRGRASPVRTRQRDPVR